MEDFNLKQETPLEGVNALIINDHREYTIKIDEKTKYMLRLELKDKKIYLIVSLEDKIEYNYRTFMDLSTIVNKLELNSIKYNKLELILKIFDQLYENNKISIQINNDEYYFLIIKLLQITKEEIYEIKIYKHYMNPDDKFKIMFNLIKELKNENNEIKNEMNNKINKLNETIEEKNKNINEMNSKLINQENKIKELNKKIVTLTNDYNNSKGEIKKFNNLFTNQNDIIKNNKIYLENKIYNDNKEIDLNKELIDRNNEKFKKNPKNLKCECNITTTNTPTGWNDM